ncbi:MAG: Rossmann-like and DUF2520 domain-containing protein [Candidatus Limnocylindrales bacterium]
MSEPSRPPPEAPEGVVHEHGQAELAGAHARAHAEGRPHLHGRGEVDDPEGPPRLGIVGAGRVGLVLGRAFSAAGWPVVAVASRDPARRERFRAAVPGARAYPEAAAVLDDVEIAFLTVPDDAIPAVVGGLRLYAGQGLVHTSGLLPAAVLAPAMGAGTLAASFHPLIAFADPDQALQELAGATIALEGDEPLVALLGELAAAIGAHPVRLPAGAKSAYHAAAVMAAGAEVALLDAIAAVGRGAGLDEDAALAIYLPLVRQTLDNAARLGIRGALTGPIVRGDLGTVRAHLDALERLAPDALPLYRAAAMREIELAIGAGWLDVARAAALRALLAPGAAASPS